MFRFSPSCNCCGCTIFEDDFNRSDSTDIGTKWTEVSGGAAISTNKLRMTTAGDLVVGTKSYTTENAVVKVQIYPTTGALDATGKKCQVIVDYDDADNFHFLEVRAHSSGGFDLVACRIGKRTAGTDAYLAAESTAVELGGGQVLVKVCISATHLAFYCEGVSGQRVASRVAITPHAGRKVGLKVKETLTFDFDSFELLKSYLDDERCEVCEVSCDCCAATEEHPTDTAPAVLRVTLPTFSGGGCCADFNGMVIDVPFLESFEGLCYWEVEVEDPCGGDPEILQIEIDCGGSPTAINIGFLAGTATALVTDPDCFAFDGMEIGPGTIGCTPDDPLLLSVGA